MRLADIRFLLGYDRWATRRLLAVLDGVPGPTWSASGVVGDLGLGAICVHQLGAHQRWRLALGGDEEAAQRTYPERDPLLTPAELVRAWDVEWASLDAFLDTIDDAYLERRHEGVALWQMLAHLANHGTQHRSEGASILTAIGRSPGELDMIFHAEELAREGG